MKQSDHTRRWREANPDKHRAHGLVRAARRRGALAPEPCDLCGSECLLHAHHDDHAAPFDIQWLCASCHGRVTQGVIDPNPRVNSDLPLTLGYWKNGECEPHDPLEYAETLARMRSAMNGLSARQRAMLQMRVIDGMFLHEIGDSFGLTKERVRVIVKDALDQLREAVAA